MKKAHLFVCAAGATTLALLAVACGGVQQGVQAGKEGYHLGVIYSTYQSYSTAKGKPPATVDELIQFATTQTEKDSLQEVKNGNFTIQWGAPVGDATKYTGPLNTYVVGYASKPNGNMRTIMTADGQVTSVQESAFTGMTKAKAGGNK